jgi:hypothetical protein
MSDEELTQAIAELQEVVRCHCDEAFRDRGLQDPQCQCDSAEAVKVVANRIKALTKERDEAVHLARLRKTFIEEARDERDEAQAKLAKALEALEAFKEFDDLPTQVKRPDLFEIKVRKPILRTLAEIKGESHD